jgi:hypothetical protein
MADPDYALRWIPFGLARDPRYRHIIEKQRRISKEHIEDIWAEQEAMDAARHWPDGPPLRIADRYAGGRPRRGSQLDVSSPPAGNHD